MNLARRNWIALVITAFVFVLLVALGRLMLPIADDYCYASNARDGLLNALVHRYQLEGGNLFETFVVLIQVGLPLTLASPNFGSAFAWAVTLLFVCVAFVVVLMMCIAKLQIKTAMLWAFSLLATLWLPYWWLPGIIPGLERVRPVFMRTARDMTFWHSMQSQYIVVPVILATIMILARRTTARPVCQNLLLAIVGLFLGTSSLILAGGFSLTSFIAVLIPRARKVVGFRRVTGVFSGVAIGVAIQVTAPGTFGRLTQVHGSSTTGDMAHRLFSAVVGGFIESPLWLVVCLVNLGTVVSVLSGLLMGQAFKRASFSVLDTRARSMAIWLFGFGFALVYCEKVLEKLTYFALWHMTYARFAFLLAGLALGIWFSAISDRVKLRPFVMTFSASTLVLLSLVLSASSVLIVAQARYASWKAHPYSQGDAAEATASSWVLDCAKRAGIR